MKANKGFTLIELLAVIVILAVIALIATPTILGVIETARKGAAESSALGYIDAVEKAIVISEVDETIVKLPNGTYAIADLKTAGVKVKGDYPDSGSVVIAGNEVTDAQLTFGKYKVVYDADGSDVAKVVADDDYTEATPNMTCTASECKAKSAE